jgi:Zn-dependent metalloprotease
VTAAALTGAVTIVAGRDAALQEPQGSVSVTAGFGTSVDVLRQWDATVDAMARTAELVVTSRRADRALADRTHEYLAQVVGGVRVVGGGVARQLDESGVTVSLFGTLHQSVAMDTTPQLSATEVVARVEESTDASVQNVGAVVLVVLPLPLDGYALTYRVLMNDGRIYFADADSGGIVHVMNAFDSQSAIGAGATYYGDRRKVSMTRAGPRFEAHDRMRPAEVVTLDLRFNFDRYLRLLYDHLDRNLPFRQAIWTAGDIAADADNEWDDPAVVEAHAHTGWTYDYLLERHGWQAVDGANGRIVSIVNAGFRDAVAFRPPLGPEGAGTYVYGRSADETSEEPWTSLDIVAHELMHGVTYFSVNERIGNNFGLGTNREIAVRLGPSSVTDRDGRTHRCSSTRLLLGYYDTDDGRREEYRVPAWCAGGRFILASSQGGAVNEAYSDIIAESAGFFFEDAGASADYLVAADHDFGPIRSLVNPRSHGNPDLYRDRFEFALALDREQGFWTYSGFTFVDGRFVGDSGGCCYGGEHWNSLILSHAFYLAIEGGRHRASAVEVNGVGSANRAEVERIFFRALTDLMPAATSLPQAADAIRQSAADLAAGSAAQRSVDQALHAVGL